ncbi:hypothetical protein CupriaWKF_11495 [Cupriavidus sp. WKF15]|uniref:hypothetical protein n=1 Tax=Cupriavidus sp. WKF15 TaxID=3032282 RepID=UPI0023E34A2F|nr:hypothetical protein [Cupriavidus sp. WKF15]WER44947.1 hypothetical protein CupriaWKF_11495 [Cupriavidus sp. WKF15]
MPAPIPTLNAPIRYALGPGQALRRHAARGTVIHVTEGRVEVALPLQWAAVGTFDLCHRLLPGAVLVLAERGWLTVTANGAAEVMWQEPAPGAWQRTWRGLAGWLRRRAWPGAAGPVEAETR